VYFFLFCKVEKAKTAVYEGDKNYQAVCGDS